MDNQTALTLIDIATRLATAAMASKAPTASTKVGKTPATEEVFADCLKEVEAHFSRLIGQ